MLLGMTVHAPPPAASSSRSPAGSPVPSMRFAVAGCLHAILLELPRDAALDLFEWLGLGRPELGAIEARALAPLCRRRLWPIARNQHPTLRRLAGDLLAVAEVADGALVVFG
jgi:hypothetical protein